MQLTPYLCTRYYETVFLKSTVWNQKDKVSRPITPATNKTFVTAIRFLSGLEYGYISTSSVGRTFRTEEQLRKPDPLPTAPRVQNYLETAQSLGQRGGVGAALGPGVTTACVGAVLASVGGSSGPSSAIGGDGGHGGAAAAAAPASVATASCITPNRAAATTSSCLTPSRREDRPPAKFGKNFLNHGQLTQAVGWLWENDTAGMQMALREASTLMLQFHTGTRFIQINEAEFSRIEVIEYSKHSAVDDPGLPTVTENGKPLELFGVGSEPAMR